MKWTAYVAVCVLLVQAVYAQLDINSWVSDAAQGWTNATSSAMQGWSSAVNGYSTSASSDTALPTSTAPVTVSAYDPNQSYSKAIGTLLTYGASAQSLSQYVASKYASDASAGSSFLSSVTASAQKSNTANLFNSQGSSTGTANPVDPNDKNSAMLHVPTGPLTVLCTCVVALLGAGVVFL
ncbi:hypothetical protein MBRA1_002333 [Malassezia brasiliensis]|uniref:Uncharacterized protein n=1 Tax=Malassezia brasiliensis TaxID=1821822 RepID=A0AAF0DY49_9BASI|nr:hypothetical protein MBRA1_002333 [Malassezia brasiliensis]